MLNPSLLQQRHGSANGWVCECASKPLQWWWKKDLGVQACICFKGGVRLQSTGNLSCTFSGGSPSSPAPNPTHTHLHSHSHSYTPACTHKYRYTGTHTHTCLICWTGYPVLGSPRQRGRAGPRPRAHPQDCDCCHRHPAWEGSRGQNLARALAGHGGPNDRQQSGFWREGLEHVKWHIMRGGKVGEGNDWRQWTG